MKQVINYNFACYKRPTEWPEEANTTIRLKTELFNRLAEAQTD